MKNIKDIKTRISIKSISIVPCHNLGWIELPSKIGKYVIFDRAENTNGFSGKGLTLNDPMNNYEITGCYSHNKLPLGFCMHAVPSTDNPSLPDCLLEILSEKKSIGYRSANHLAKELNAIYETHFKLASVTLEIDFIYLNESIFWDQLNNSINLGVRWLQAKKYRNTYEPSSLAYQLSFEEKPVPSIYRNRFAWTIRIKLFPQKLPNCFSTIENLGSEDLSWLYGKNSFFWFHFPNFNFAAVKSGSATTESLWLARNYMQKKYKVSYTKFYKEYLAEHPYLSELTLMALDRFRWNPIERHC